MKKYVVKLRGESFEIFFDNEEKNVGFYATRVVKANNESEAENKAVDLVKNDQSLLSTLVPNSNKNPKVYVESVSPAKFWQKIGGTGYVFWPMDE